MSNDVFDVFLLRGKEEENGGLTFDPETGLYLRRAEVVQEQGARDEEGRGWERAVVEERVGEGGRGWRSRRGAQDHKGEREGRREGEEAKIRTLITGTKETCNHEPEQLH